MWDAKGAYKARAAGVASAPTSRKEGISRETEPWGPAEPSTVCCPWPRTRSPGELGGDCFLSPIPGPLSQSVYEGSGSGFYKLRCDGTHTFSVCGLDFPWIFAAAAAAAAGQSLLNTQDTHVVVLGKLVALLNSLDDVRGSDGRSHTRVTAKCFFSSFWRAGMTREE